MSPSFLLHFFSWYRIIKLLGRKVILPRTVTVKLYTPIAKKSPRGNDYKPKVTATHHTASHTGPPMKPRKSRERHRKICFTVWQMHGGISWCGSHKSSCSLISISIGSSSSSLHLALRWLLNLCLLRRLKDPICRTLVSTREHPGIATLWLRQDARNVVCVC